MDFLEVEPTLENYWRSVILFGKNVASYKFALAKALHDLKASSNDFIKLDTLAEPFAKHLIEHLQHTPKQITSKSSRFISACQDYIDKRISYDEVIATTVKLGFANVIDAFHNVNGNELAKRFFIDERKESKGIRLTDNFLQLSQAKGFNDLNIETEARWRLVETGWELGISRQLIGVQFDNETEDFFTTSKERRVDITSSRDSLNGYQKGRCFYCYDHISIETKDDDLADVDHFFPWTANEHLSSLNGIWNLVLACKDCNRGTNGKFAKVPSIDLLSRLYQRNEFLISSHLPLRETLIQQTGERPDQRRNFLQKQYNTAIETLIHTWEPLAIKGIATF